MAQAMKKAKTMPFLPPMALPMATISRVRQVRSRVVFNLFIVVTSDCLKSAGANKKDLYPGVLISRWIKVLHALT